MKSRKWLLYLIVAFIWLYAFSFSIVPALDIGLSRYVPEGFLTTCSFDYLNKTTDARIFMFIFFIFAWAIPFATIIFCYTKILQAVAATNQIRVQSNKAKEKTEVKLAIVIVNIIMLWFIAWSPYAIVALIGISGHEDLLTPLLSMIPAIFCKTSACVNPYLYSLTHPRFKLEVKRFLRGEPACPMGRISSVKTVIYTSSKRKINEIQFVLEREPSIDRY